MPDSHVSRERALPSPLQVVDRGNNRMGDQRGDEEADSGTDQVSSGDRLPPHAGEHDHRDDGPQDRDHVQRCERPGHRRSSGLRDRLLFHARIIAEEQETVKQEGPNDV